MIISQPRIKLAPLSVFKHGPYSMAVKIRFETSKRIRTSARISTSLPKKLEIELKSDFLDNLDSKWFLKMPKFIK